MTASARRTDEVSAHARRKRAPSPCHLARWASRPSMCTATGTPFSCRGATSLRVPAVTRAPRRNRPASRGRRSYAVWLSVADFSRSAAEVDQTGSRGTAVQLLPRVAAVDGYVPPAFDEPGPDVLDGRLEPARTSPDLLVPIRATRLTTGGRARSTPLWTLVPAKHLPDNVHFVFTPPGRFTVRLPDE